MNAVDLYETRRLAGHRVAEAETGVARAKAEWTQASKAYKRARSHSTSMARLLVLNQAHRDLSLARRDLSLAEAAYIRADNAVKAHIQQHPYTPA